MVASRTQTDVRLSLPARAENVAVVRHVMGAFGESCELSDARMADVRLAVTEACTNVVRHAYDRAGGVMDVLIQPSSAGLEVTVSDTGRGIEPSGDRSGPGFGLPMLATLTDSLEVDRESGPGSRVVMRFERAREPAGTA